MTRTTASTATAAVIALGRHDRGDAAAGLVVAEILRQRLPDDVTVVTAPAGLADLVDVLRRHEVVFVVDALRPGRRPGAVHRFDPSADAPAPECGQHALSLADVVTDARTREVAPREVIAIGIEGRWFTPEAGVSPEVCGAAHDVADEIVGAVSG